MKHWMLASSMLVLVAAAAPARGAEVDYAARFRVLDACLGTKLGEVSNNGKELQAPGMVKAYIDMVLKLAMAEDMDERVACLEDRELEDLTTNKLAEIDKALPLTTYKRPAGENVAPHKNNMQRAAEIDKCLKADYAGTLARHESIERQGEELEKLKQGLVDSDSLVPFVQCMDDLSDERFDAQMNELAGALAGQGAGRGATGRATGQGTRASPRWRMLDACFGTRLVEIGDDKAALEQETDKIVDALLTPMELRPYAQCMEEREAEAAENAKNGIDKPLEGYFRRPTPIAKKTPLKKRMEELDVCFDSALAKAETPAQVAQQRQELRQTLRTYEDLGPAYYCMIMNENNKWDDDKDVVSKSLPLDED